MIAEKLREAARRARMDSMNGGDKFLDAVADWLDATADDLDRLAPPLAEFSGSRYCHRCDEGFMGGQCLCWLAPLAVAVAYLDAPVEREAVEK